MRNRVAKINEKDYIQWRHAPTSKNPSDIARRGCSRGKLKDSWFEGPVWVMEKELWPPNVATKDTEESEREAKTAKLICKAAVEDDDSLDHVFKFKKRMRITTREKRFIANYEIKKNERKRGLTTTDEFNKARE